MPPDPTLTPELIQSRSFTTGFRGYDQSEVREFLTRVASEVKALSEHVQRLESAWRSAEERAARPPVLDEDTLMAAVGEETASILRSARAAAADLKAKASEEAQRIRSEAQGLLAEEKKRAEQAAGGILEAARAEAEQIVERARAEAEAIRVKAEQERALTIDGANSTRERILEDLSRRRRVASVQIEQLRAGRERLLQAYGLVRRTLEEVQEELARADAEARAAAEETGRRLQREAEEMDHPQPPARAQEAAEVANPVDNLFARIRQGAAPPAADHSPAEVELSVQVGLVEGAGATGDPGAEQEMGPAPEDEAWLQKREALVMDLETSLTRRLKRALQDDQNDLLDRLRGLRGEVAPAVLLPDLEGHLERFVRTALPLVEQAAAAGRGFATEALGGLPPATGSPDVSDLAWGAASAIVDQLRRRLEEVIAAGTGEEQSVLVESLGSAYREWKSQRIERVAGDAIAAAFARGTWAAVPEGASFRWIAEDVEGPCPDCDDDALAGSLPKGEQFPTGQLHPPAHPGCRCLLVPVGS